MKYGLFRHLFPISEVDFGEKPETLQRILHHKAPQGLGQYRLLDANAKKLASQEMQRCWEVIRGLSEK